MTFLTGLILCFFGYKMFRNLYILSTILFVAPSVYCIFLLCAEYTSYPNHNMALVFVGFFLLSFTIGGMIMNHQFYYTIIALEVGLAYCIIVSVILKNPSLADYKMRDSSIVFLLSVIFNIGLRYWRIDYFVMLTSAIWGSTAIVFSFFQIKRLGSGHIWTFYIGEGSKFILSYGLYVSVAFVVMVLSGLVF